MSTKDLSGDKDWGTVYAILVNELELMVDRRRGQPDLVYEPDIQNLGRIIDELSHQGVRLTK